MGLNTWLHRQLCGLSGHKDMYRFERTEGGNRMFLECSNCGRETKGWMAQPYNPDRLDLGPKYLAIERKRP